MNKSTRYTDRGILCTSIEEFSYALPYVQLVVISTIMIIITVITIIANALVMISFTVDKRLRTLTNYFLLSLAVSDFMIATFSMPLFILYLLKGEWTLGPILCDMWLSQDYTGSNVSFLNLLMIAIDRYYSVTDPLRYRAKRTARRVGLMIACVWVLAFLIWPPWIYAWPYIEGQRTVPDDDCYIQFLGTNPYATILTAVIDFYVPVFIILVLYYKIWRVTRQRNKYLANMESEFQSQSVSLRKKQCSEETSDGQPMPKQRSQVKCVNGQDIGIAEDNETNKEVVTRWLSRTGDDKMEAMPDEEQPATDLNSARSKMTVAQKISMKNDNKATRVLTAILLSFLLTMTPYNILVIIISTHGRVSFFLWNFCYFLFYVNSTFNPLCYALANENFRRTYWAILSSVFCRKKARRGVGSDNYSNMLTGK